MKKIVTVVVVIIGVYLIWNAIQTKPDANVPNAEVSNEVSVNNEADINKDDEFLDATVSFKGFGPGKEHIGSFSGVDSKISLVDGMLSGAISIDMSTLSADNEKVTEHLKSADFFDVAKFPAAFFSINEAKDGMISGSMVVRGITKTITFPYTESDSAYTATFNLNMKEFGIEQAFANEVVELSIVVNK
jgi:polyisoprenoid-binding protein YceI